MSAHAATSVAGEYLQRPLQSRDYIILQALADGENYDYIGRERLHTTGGTVKMYAHRLFHRIGADNRTHAVALAFRRGLIR